MRTQRKMGFTLIEMMIVVAIIGMLAVIALPSFANARTKSQRNTCIDHLRQISGGKDQYALSNNGLAPVDIPSMVGEIFRREPTCPAGGTYAVEALGVEPTCSQAGTLGHTL